MVAKYRRRGYDSERCYCTPKAHLVSQGRKLGGINCLSSSKTTHSTSLLHSPKERTFLPYLLQIAASSLRRCVSKSDGKNHPRLSSKSFLFRATRMQLKKDIKRQGVIVEMEKGRMMPNSLSSTKSLTRNGERSAAQLTLDSLVSSLSRTETSRKGKRSSNRTM